MELPIENGTFEKKCCRYVAILLVSLFKLKLLAFVYIENLFIFYFHQLQQILLAMPKRRSTRPRGRRKKTQTILQAMRRLKKRIPRRQPRRRKRRRKKKRWLRPLTPHQSSTIQRALQKGIFWKYMIDLSYGKVLLGQSQVAAPQRQSTLASRI